MRARLQRSGAIRNIFVRCPEAALAAHLHTRGGSRTHITPRGNGFYDRQKPLFCRTPADVTCSQLRSLGVRIAEVGTRSGTEFRRRLQAEPGNVSAAIHAVVGSA